MQYKYSKNDKMKKGYVCTIYKYFPILYVIGVSVDTNILGEYWKFYN